MANRWRFWTGGILLLGAAVNCVAAESPRVESDKYKFELIAREPDIVTPIALAFDRQGRLLVVESHTHQRPADYKGPTSDRLRMLADSDGDGRLDRWTTFAEGFQSRGRPARRGPTALSTS